MHVFKDVSIGTIQEVAAYIITNLDAYPIVLLKGEMGAGKTTLMGAIMKQLGTKDEVSSPTFALVNDYQTNKGIVHHFDLYRLKNLEEALQIGIEEYLDSGNSCFIEWHQIIEPLLSEALVVEIEKASENLRTFRIFKF